MPTRHRTNVDVNAAVAEAIRFASMGPQASFEIESRLGADLPEVSGVPDQLVQVLLNLLLNARKALESWKDPEIVVTTGEVDGWIEIRVADNGPGVPSELREQIFDPFFTTGKPNEGTGLGLSIAFDIVVAHAGTLELETSRGGGATFVVRVPVPGAEAESA